MKNVTTPRTLEDSSFQVGYRGYVPSRSRWTALGFAATLALWAVIGLLLAWRG
jgi:hypothetical protein